MCIPTKKGFYKILTLKRKKKYRKSYVLISVVSDYYFGNGAVDLIQKVFCKILCFTKKVVVEEAKMGVRGQENPVSFPVLFIEVVVLTITIVILNRYKKCHGADRIDELLDESKEALRQTNEFLEKWRLRRVHWQTPKDSYLDDEPQDIKPIKVEIPILHMAIVDTLGNTRSLERGDAGDSANITDSAILSVTSLDDEFESIPDPSILDDMKNEFHNRYLWNVSEETDYSEQM